MCSAFLLIVEYTLYTHCMLLCEFLILAAVDSFQDGQQQFHSPAIPSVVCSLSNSKELACVTLKAAVMMYHF